MSPTIPVWKFVRLHQSRSGRCQFDDAEQLYINPDECIDCVACVEVCPVLAIHEADCLPEKWQHYAAINREYFAERSNGA